MDKARIEALAEDSAIVEFEIWQDGGFCAGASGPREDAEREARHYALVYGQDGPVTVYQVTRTDVTELLRADAVATQGEGP